MCDAIIHQKMSTDDPDYHGGIRTSMMTWHDGAIVTLQNLRSAASSALTPTNPSMSEQAKGNQLSGRSTLPKATPFLCVCGWSHSHTLGSAWVWGREGVWRWVSVCVSLLWECLKGRLCWKWRRGQSAFWGGMWMELCGHLWPQSWTTTFDSLWGGSNEREIPRKKEAREKERECVCLLRGGRWESGIEDERRDEFFQLLLRDACDRAWAMDTKSYTDPSFNMSRLNERLMGAKTLATNKEMSTSIHTHTHTHTHTNSRE